MATQHTPGVYKFPYPDGTELVRNGDNAIQALAEAVEIALDPPWVDLALANGARGHTDGLKPQYRIFDNARIEFKGCIVRDAQFETFDVVFTLPAPARPTKDVRLAVALTRTTANDTAYPVGKIEVHPDGTGTIHIPNDQEFHTVSLDGVYFYKL